MKLESINGCVLNRNCLIKRSNKDKSPERSNFDALKNNNTTFKALDINYGLYGNKIISKGLPLSLTEKLSKEALMQAEKLKHKLNKYIDTSDGFWERIVTTKNYDFEMLDGLFDSFIERGIQPSYFVTTVNSVQTYSTPTESVKNINYDDAIRLLHFRDKAIEHKHLLTTHGRAVRDSEVDVIIFSTPYNTIETLNILGEKAFILAFKDKETNLYRYVKSIGENTLTEENREKLIQLTNPTFSEKYRNLKEEIRTKKSSYRNIEPENKQQLENNINTLTYNLNELQNNAIKDPKNILEATLIAVSFLNKTKVADDFINAIHEEEGLTGEKLTKILSENFYHYYKLETPPENVTERLQFKESKYLLELFKSNEKFRDAFTDLITLMETAPEKSNIELFNNLPQNIETRKQFEELGLNYDKWSGSEPISFTTNKGYTFRKVDMNNIPYALFLGNHSDCCTRTNGLYSYSAVSYIRNKMFQAIEVLDKNNKPIGNTMCYIAKLNDTPCLVLDNIEMNKSYKTFEDDQHILDNIKDVAKQITHQIGTPDMPILLGTRTNDISTIHLKSYLYNTELVGSSGKNNVYFDFARRALKTDEIKCSPEDFYPLTENYPEPLKIPSNHKKFNLELTINGETRNVVATNISPNEYFNILNTD